MKKYWYFLLLLLVGNNFILQAQIITSSAQPAELIIRKISDNCLRISLVPLSNLSTIPENPSLVNEAFTKPVLQLRSITATKVQVIGHLTVRISNAPLSIMIYNKQQKLIQKLVFEDNQTVSFNLNEAEKILGMGEGGPKPERGINWRTQAVQFDRRGKIDSMQPRWQGDAYGSRNPSPMLIGTSGWGVFVAAPWVLVDLRDPSKGHFIPWQPPVTSTIQNQRNQGLNNGKGLPPVNEMIKGFFDVFVFDATDPSQMMRDFSMITGPAVLPPKWALGYMQSHRTLEDDAQMTGIVDTFRHKQIPIDAVIYLGTGFTPRGWNKMQPSFEFNPAVFKRDPVQVIDHMHKNNVKVILHMVPWDRDKLPNLHGTIPAKPTEVVDGAHIERYWKEHLPLVKAGVDAFWPDEGDWFNLHERIKRHQLYFQGHLNTTPNKRPWSLQRNGYPGIAQWGGWVWSGDTESTWKTLEAQIAVGINYSLSIAPFWGSDIGGFYPTEDYSGEMYARWHQFASFNASFRSHGRSWWLHLPWGWGRSAMGPAENRAIPPTSAMNNFLIEPVIKQYNELRYMLMPYTYTVAWEAKKTGMPMMRALWLHYPNDTMAASIGNQFLWGRDLLVAPVFEKNADSRNVYLPTGTWYDWWTNETIKGGTMVRKSVNLQTMPLYVKAGAIIPVDSIRQSTHNDLSVALTIKVYEGANGHFELYEDDGESTDYQMGKYQITKFSWNQQLNAITIESLNVRSSNKIDRKLTIELIGRQIKKTIRYQGKKMTVLMDRS